MKILQFIDKLLNNITMYRLLVYGLSALLAGATIFSLLGKLYISAPALLAISAVILTVVYITDRLLTTLWGSNTNHYSSLITGLILCFILPPTTSVHNLALAGFGALIAIASKYFIALHYKHIFNPAAFAAIILGLTGLLPATWWIGSPAMLPLTIIFGLLVLRKIRRYQLFFSFLASSLIVTILLGIHHHLAISYILSTAFKSSPLIFLGTIMLTEPSTTPSRLWQQRIYGLIVGAIFLSQIRYGSISATPELALIVGNLYAYFVSPKQKFRLQLKGKVQLAPNIYELNFTGGKKFKFKPGQYLEWTLPRIKPDSRGNRRTFSIASAPGDEDLNIAIKTSKSSSRFKSDLMNLKPKDIIVAGQLSGDFVLPNNLNQKLVFIAGGIGITPFVSMVKNMIKTKQKRDVILIYLVSSPSDLCYMNLWKRASELGLRIVPVLSNPHNKKGWTGLVGRLNENILHSKVTDYLDRTYYLSGPPALVDNYSKLLRQIKIKRKHIVTDHFSGY